MLLVEGSHRAGRTRARSGSDTPTLTADTHIEALTDNLPAPDFPTTAFTTPPPLSEATVARATARWFQDETETARC